MKRVALAAMLGLMAFAPAQAATTVTYLNIATGNDKAVMEELAKEYMAMHPDVIIELPTLENEAFKAKLTTLLQTNEAPDIINSWGGGVFYEQARAGVLRPVDDVLSQEAKDAVGTAGVAAYTAPDGHIYGLARDVSEVVLWYNKPLFAQAGVDPASMGTWDGFLAGVKKLKDAGITPLALGGKDKWPAHFWWSKLVVRLAGQDGFNAAAANEGDGFAGEAFVKAGEYFLQLAQLEPFQEGFLAATYGDASGYFGDGKAAMHLMGDWDYSVAKDNSASKQCGRSDRYAGWPGRRAVHQERVRRSGQVHGVVQQKGEPGPVRQRRLLHPDHQGCSGWHDQPVQGADRQEHRRRALARKLLRPGSGARRWWRGQRHLG
jgi:raffinose/stachyose/melibiose transport system substrate-binding protein